MTKSQVNTKLIATLSLILAGMAFPLGFAPFHLPGMSLLSLAYFYYRLNQGEIRQALANGFCYGIGLFGFGVSWVVISVHDYGSLSYPAALLITLAFIGYLSLFTALLALCYRWFKLKTQDLRSVFLFATLWIVFEYLRANLMTGFPWLLLGTSQLDTPLRSLIPIIGLYGTGFLACLAAALLAYGWVNRNGLEIIAFVLILILPSALKDHRWTQLDSNGVSVAVVQANLSMRDKWDEQLFQQLLEHYQTTIEQLLGKALIVLPESAIPLPASYLEDYLETINQKALLAKSAIVSGILKPVNLEETEFFNTMTALGQAEGEYRKQHLVPFGEYIPKPFKLINRILGLPEADLLPGQKDQQAMRVKGYAIASLICYEIAYPELLRQQLGLARWIVAVSDNGWFGHSLASYQQTQMAQLLALITGRYAVIANNDGLSSVINDQGKIVNSLPAFQAGILESSLLPAEGLTPWAYWGDRPVLIILLLILAVFLLRRIKIV